MPLLFVFSVYIISLCLLYVCKDKEKDFKRESRGPIRFDSGPAKDKELLLSAMPGNRQTGGVYMCTVCTGPSLVQSIQASCTFACPSQKDEERRFRNNNAKSFKSIPLEQFR